jgi:hypothetical protein
MDSGGSLEKRGRTLEDEFFHRVDQQLMEQMRAKMEAEEQRKALAAACGLADERLLDALAAAHVTPESLAALTLVPLVRVGWADGRMEAPERAAILQAAAENNCPPGSLGHSLLASWLNAPPTETLFQAWREYTRRLCEDLEHDACRNLSDRIVGRARDIATAAGGILGLGAISALEKAALQEVEQAFVTAD